jgi:Dolichyl-phosphate-mannose-protein mannosyltransferase
MAIGAGAAIVLLAWGLRAMDPGHDLPLDAPGENRVHLFGELDRETGPDPLTPLVFRTAHDALLKLEYLTAYALQRAGGSVEGREDFGARLIEDPGPFWKVARIGVALLGAATVLLLFRHGRRLGGTRVGVIAAVLLALSAGHVEASRRVLPECAIALFSFWALSLIVEAARERREVPTWRFVLIGAAAARFGWAGILLLVPYLGSTIEQYGVRGGFSMRSLRPALFAAALALTGGLVAGSLRSPVPAVGLSAAGTALLASARGLWHGGGPAWLILAVLGCVLAARRGRPDLLLHVQYLLALAVALILTPIGDAAALVAVPVFCLMAAFAVVWLTDEALPVSRFRTPAMVAVTMLAAALPAAETWHLIGRDRATDTRVAAARWLEENVPPHTPLVVPMDPQVHWQSSLPVWDLVRNMKRDLPWVQREDPAAVAYWNAGIRSRKLVRYDLRLDEIPSAADARESTGPLPAYAVVPPSEAAWSGEVVATFGGDGRAAKGPALEIRRLAGASAVPEPVDDDPGGDDDPS